MKIKSIAAGAVMRLASAGPNSAPLKVGDEVRRSDAIRIENGPSWPAHAVEFEDDSIGNGRIGGMVIG